MLPWSDFASRRTWSCTHVGPHVSHGSSFAASCFLFATSSSRASAVGVAHHVLFVLSGVRQFLPPALIAQRVPQHPSQIAATDARIPSSCYLERNLHLRPAVCRHGPLSYALDRLRASSNGAFAADCSTLGESRGARNHGITGTAAKAFVWNAAICNVFLKSLQLIIEGGWRGRSRMRWSPGSTTVAAGPTLPPPHWQAGAGRSRAASDGHLGTPQGRTQTHQPCPEGV